MKRKPPILIAIVGGSGAGKSCLARQLESLLAPNAARMALDDFYRDLSHLTFAQRERINFDNPRAIDWLCLEDCLRNLLLGHPTRLPQYDFSIHCRRPKTVRWAPKPFVLVDGLWLLRRSSLRRLFARRIFVDCPSDLRLARRIKRDMAERGRSRKSVEKQYRENVAPMHDRFVEPQRKHADLVLESPVSDKLAARLADEIRALRASFA